MAGTRRQGVRFLTMLVLRFDTDGPIRECMQTRRTTTPTGRRTLNTDSITVPRLAQCSREAPARLRPFPSRLQRFPERYGVQKDFRGKV